jgi:hypothetical protein
MRVFHDLYMPSRISVFSQPLDGICDQSFNGIDMASAKSSDRIVFDQGDPPGCGLIAPNIKTEDPVAHPSNYHNCDAIARFWKPISGPQNIIRNPSGNPTPQTGIEPHSRLENIWP